MGNRRIRIFKPRKIAVSRTTSSARWIYLKKILKAFRDIQIVSLLILLISASIYGYQAFIGRQQLNINKDQEQRQLRAYVGKSNTEILVYSDDAETISLKLTFKNFGQTPAYYPHGLVSSTTQDLQPDNTYDTNPDNLDEDFKLGTIYSGQEYYATFQSFSFKEVMTRFQGTQPMLVWYGILFYQDAFGIDRKTHFCFTYAVYSVKDIVKDAPTASIRDCANANDDFDD